MGSTPPPPPPPPPGWQPGPPPGAPLPPPPPARRTPWGLIIGIIVAVVVLIGVGVVAGFAVLRDDDADDDTTTSESVAPETPAGEATLATDEPSAEGSTEVAPETAPETEDSPSPTVTVDTSDVVGSWEGAYECGQGDTGLSLEVSEGAAEGELTAIFHFRKIPSNPDVPEGSYTMKGFLEDGKLRLRRLEWIDRPEGFVMVGLNARITERDPETITGTVSNLGCGVFEIDRK